MELKQVFVVKERLVETSFNPTIWDLNILQIKEKNTKYLVLTPAYAT